MKMMIRSAILEKFWRRKLYKNVKGGCSVKEITVHDLIRADGTLDRERLSRALGNGVNRTDFLNDDPGWFKKPSEQKRISVGDQVSISETGMKQLLAMQANRKEDTEEYIKDPFQSVQYNLAGAATYMGKLSKIAGNISKGENGFEEHVTSFAMAYQELKDEIHKKYSAGAPAQIATNQNGEEYVMTEEEEMAMLDEAYKNITTFMSTTARVVAEGRARRGELPDDLTEEVEKKAAMAYEKAISERNLQAIKEKLENQNSEKESVLDFGLDQNWLGIINSLYQSK